MIYSSKTTGLFHDPGLGGELPPDVIEIPIKLHAELMKGQASGRMISFDTVPPSLVERPPMTRDQLADIERSWRDGQLAKTDGVVVRHRDELESLLPTTITAGQYMALQNFRRNLRDWPQGPAFPLADHRPPAPVWLADQIQ